jgi:hypothetical protein
MSLPKLPFAPGTRVRLVDPVSPELEPFRTGWIGYTTGGFVLPPHHGLETIQLQVWWQWRGMDTSQYPYSWELVHNLEEYGVPRLRLPRRTRRVRYVIRRTDCVGH